MLRWSSCARLRGWRAGILRRLRMPLGLIVYCYGIETVTVLESTHFCGSALTPGRSGDFNRVRPQGTFECLTPEQKLKTATWTAEVP